MKSRGIIMSGESVRGILANRKTQTRRVCRPQPDDYPSKHPGAYIDAYCGEPKTTTNPRGMSDTWCWWLLDWRQGPDWARCPYGAPGTRLWVREAFAYSVRDPDCSHNDDYSEDTHDIVYRADYDGGDWDHYEPNADGTMARSKVPPPWRSPLHMPRWASRLTLEVVNVRAERVNEISEADARGEGVETASDAPTYREAYMFAWDSLNAKRGYPWSANPWVWVVSFKRVEGTDDAGT